MARQIVISCYLKQVLVGVLENGRMIEFFLEREHYRRTVGNIYKGKVENVLPGMNAAFVDIGLERNGFLYGGDVPGGADRPIDELLRRGQEILVQVAKEAEGSKGARLHTELTLAGRYLVLLPTEKHVGISRQIQESQERDRLRTIAEQLQPEGMGLIVRTVAAEQSEDELVRDCQYLLSAWRRLEKKAQHIRAPGLVFQDHSLVYRIARDLLTDDVQEVIVDHPSIHRQLGEAILEMQLDVTTCVELYQGRIALFDQLGVTKDLEKATKKWVWLDCGGYIVIDHTEALTSIDVNTGKYVGSKNLGETICKTNLEAAQEIARQLRLRNIGGIIIIDFIDMESAEERQQVLDALKQALAKDKVKTHVLGFTHLGLVEMTRKKSKTALTNMLETNCPTCGGSGRVLASDTIAFYAAQKIAAAGREQETQAIRVRCHPSVAGVLIGERGEHVRSLKARIGREVTVEGDGELGPATVEISIDKR